MTRDEFNATWNGLRTRIREGNVLDKLNFSWLENNRGFRFHSGLSLRDGQERHLYGPWLKSRIEPMFETCPCLKVEYPTVVAPIATAEGIEGYALNVKRVDQGLDATSVQVLTMAVEHFADFMNHLSTHRDEAQEERTRYNDGNADTVGDYARKCRERRERNSGHTQDQSPGGNSAKNGSEDMNDTIQDLLKANLNVILTGAPGTGKTYTARQVAFAMTGDTENTPEKEAHIVSVQFHPGYDYSDFVVGMKPVLVDEDNKIVKAGETGKGKTQVSFQWMDGVFKKFVARAKNAYDQAVKNDASVPKFVFLIDEINRADLSRVFGELFSLLEEEYRYYKEADGTEKNATGVKLPNGESFVIPKNLYILGTMNDIDRSVESMDFALRRRFAWREVTAKDSEIIIGNKAKDEKIAESDKKNLLDAMAALNNLIAPQSKTDDGKEDGTKGKTEETLDLRLGSEYQLGGAIFAKLEKYVGKDDDGKPRAADAKAYKDLWSNHIENILREYLRGRSNHDEILASLKKAYNSALPSECREEKYRDSPKKGDKGGNDDKDGGGNE